MNVSTSPKDFFFYIGSIVALYVSAVGIIALLFQLINILFPDAVSGMYGSYGYTSGLRSALSALIVAFPIYVFLTRAINREISLVPQKGESLILRWLTYVTLFLAGVTVAIDLIALINTFLSGEITTRFVLKVAVVLVVALMIFGYYVFDLKREVANRRAIMSGFMWVAVVMVLASIIGSFFVIGSPATARALRFDEQRVNDLQSIQWQVVDYWQQKGALPAELTALGDPIKGFMVPVDPETKQAYTYTNKGDKTFSLCATFSRPTQERDNSRAYPAMAIDGPSYWKHDAGNVCFDRTIDEDQYPITPKVKALERGI